MRFSIAVLLTALVSVVPEIALADTAQDVSTRRLLDALEERRMSDVALAVLDRVIADPTASADLKKEVPFRKAAALVIGSKNEIDSKKRAAILDEAQKSLDSFLASGAVSDRQAIEAYTQKGNLLIERGRAKADQANRPGGDPKALRAEAVKFFDEAIKCLEGTVKPGQEIKAVTNAEDAIVKVLREVTEQIKAIKEANAPKDDEKDDKKDDKAKGKPAKTPKLSPQQQRDLEALTEDQEALQAKLIQTRLITAAALFEKSKAYEAKSKEWTDVVTKSADKFKEIADKYPAKGGGLFARYYEGRNYAMLGKYDMAISTLSYLATLDAKVPLAVKLRTLALNTTLESILAEKKYDLLDDPSRKFALEDVKKLPGAQLDADLLGVKYRTAVILDLRADALDTKDAKTRAERTGLQTDARKLAIEVSKAGADFAKEAQALALKLGKEVQVTTERTFADVMDEANLALAAMQQHAADLKTAIAAKDDAKAAAAQAAVAAARDETLSKLTEAMKLGGLPDPLAPSATGEDALKEDVTIDKINHGRYLLTYLLYDSKKLEEAAAMGQFLVDRHPRAKGSPVAAKIAMAALQQLSQGSDETSKAAARKRLPELAASVMRIWPDEPVGADAAAIAIGAAVAARDAAGIVSIIDQVPATSPRRPEVLLRAGSALYREVQDARRQGEGSPRPDDKLIDAWKNRAKAALDEGLAAATAPPEGPFGQLTVAGALSRIQIALDDDDVATALSILEHPVYGPWKLVSTKNPIVQQGPLAEPALTVSLRLFIQAEKFDQAQQAMDALETVAAGAGEEASAKLTSMYLSMSRDLQGQLEQLGAGGKVNDPQVRAKAEKILGGFEKFLDRVAARDAKISSQFWVATTFLTLGSGQGTGAIVPKDRSDRYLERSGEVYGKLLEKVNDPEVAKFEPYVRLQIAKISRELKKWDEALEQMNWFLSDANRQNSLETQIQAADLLQAAGADAAAKGENDKANGFYREAAGGKKGDPVKIWGWGEIAKRVGRKLTGTDEAARQARAAFFNARYRTAECLVARAKLPGKENDKKARLDTAETVIVMTYKDYSDLGGPDMAAKFDKLLKVVQQEKGADPQGLAALKPTAPPAPAPAPAP